MRKTMRLPLFNKMYLNYSKLYNYVRWGNYNQFRDRRGGGPADMKPIQNAIKKTYYKETYQCSGQVCRKENPKTSQTGRVDNIRLDTWTTKMTMTK